MSTSEANTGPSQDLVAIFHASFHPTQGNVVDWSLKASEDINLEGVEFSTLPSGLHLVNQDVIYFTNHGHHGVCIFQRRKTTEQGHRGFRLSSLGILLAKSVRPRPWRHVPALKALVNTIHDSVAGHGVLEPTESDWEPARIFFDQRKMINGDMGGAGDWNGWSQELEGPMANPPESNPALHLSHMLRILGPSALTLYKHILARRRILLYTRPPVEAACIFCQVAADMCYENQVIERSEGDGRTPTIDGQILKGKHKESINVLGMVTLSDMDMLYSEGRTGRGWIACTTDAIFMEKPFCYDLVIDLTASNQAKSLRPTLHISQSISSQPGARGPSHRLSVIRWTWSDVKLWNELDRLVRNDAVDHAECCNPPDKAKAVASWQDPWRVYDDMCIICAGLWLGSKGHANGLYSSRNGTMANWGSIRLEGDDEFPVGSYPRNLGMGNDDRSEAGPSTPAETAKSRRRASAMSWSGAKMSGLKLNNREPSPSPTNPQERHDRKILTTLALLQTFHANTCFQLSRLASILPSTPGTVYLSPKDIQSFELSPLSSFDARYVEWLAEEYGGGSRAEAKKGSWRDWVGIILGI